MRRSRGFTLIELLVVIAIIAVLAAILFPVFARAREQARASSCLSNMKQLGNAWQMYLSDNDGTFPCASWEVSQQFGDVQGGIWCGRWAISSDAIRLAVEKTSIRAQLEPYVKNSGVWKCPSDPATSVAWPPVFNSKLFTSYPTRLWFGASKSSIAGTKDAVPVLSDTWFKDASRVFIFHEQIPFHDLRDDPSRPCPARNAYTWYADVKVNLAFLDGHAKCLAVSKAYFNWPYWGTPPGWDPHHPRLGDMNHLNLGYAYPPFYGSQPGDECLHDLDP